MTWKELPVEIQKRMLDEQVKQGNQRNQCVFVNEMKASKTSGGFNWDESTESDYFWRQILSAGKIEVFFEKYPKDVLPEKWCIKISTQDVADYCNEYGKMPPYKVDETHYAHFPPFDEVCTTCYKIQEGYTEITLEQFKNKNTMQKLTREILIKAYNKFDCNVWQNKVLELINSKPLATDNTLINIPIELLEFITKEASEDQLDYVESLGIILVVDKNAFSVMPMDALHEFSDKYLGCKHILSVGGESVKSMNPTLFGRCLVVNSDYQVNLINCPNGKTAIEILKK